MDDSEYHYELMSKKSLNYDGYKKMKRGGAILKIQSKNENLYEFDHI